MEKYNSICGTSPDPIDIHNGKEELIYSHMAVQPHETNDMCMCGVACEYNDFLLFSMMEAKVKILPEELLPPKPFHLFTCPEHIVSSATQSLALLRSCENELESMSPGRLQNLQKNITVSVLYKFSFT